MVKALGIAVILFSCAGVGVKMYLRLSLRIKTLSSAKAYMQKFENRLSSMCMPLDRCFDSDSCFLSYALQDIQQGILPAPAVRNAIARCTTLQSEDKEAFYTFASGLDAKDCDGQIANVRLLQSSIDALLANAQRELSSKGKLYIEGGALCGALIALLLL